MVESHSHWQHMKFRDVAHFINGYHFKPSDWKKKGLPIIRIQNLNDPEKTFNYFDGKCDQRYFVKNGDILISWSASLGVFIWNRGDAVLNQHIFKVLPNETIIERDYFYYSAQTKLEEMSAKVHGSTMKHITKEPFLDLEIPVPPIETQRRIAGILRFADQLRKKREQTNLMTNKMLQAVFLQLFGDPISNPRKWSLMKFNEVGTIARGRSKHRPRNAPELLGGEYPFIQTGDIANCTGHIRNYSQTYSELGLKQSKMWAKGTLCITIAANIAATGILTFDACFPDSVVGFTPNRNVRTEYVQYWLSFLQETLEVNAPKVAQRNINLKILSELDVPVPPIELQNKFSAAVERVRELEERQKFSSEKTENLFNSLMSKAFKGELLQ